jgi:hypothetical protein
MKNRVIYWIPRILALLAILFMGMFSLDSFGGDESTGKKLLGFFVHNIPVLVLIIFLVIAWKHELAGGLLFIVASIAMSIFFRSFSGNPGSIIVISPFLITGLFFVLNHFLRKKEAGKG